MSGIHSLLKVKKILETIFILEQVIDQDSAILIGIEVGVEDSYNEGYRTGLLDSVYTICKN